MGELTIAPVKRLIERAGAKRVSPKAAEELANILEGKARLVAIEAQKLAEHSGRSTVMKQDIKLAKKVLEG